MDLQVSGVSRFSVGKNNGAIGSTAEGTGSIAGFYASGYNLVFFGEASNLSTAQVTGKALLSLAQIGGPGRMQLRSGSFLGWSSSSTDPSATTDLALFQDAAGILAQRNGTAKQALRVYNTALSGAPEWAEFDWITSGGTNTLRIGTNLSGTGAARPIEFVTGGAVRMSIAAGGEVTFQNALVFGGNGRFRFLSNGVAFLTNAAENDFGRLCLGGNTSAFPAIKRNGTGIHIVLADDSGFAPLSAAGITGASFLCSALGGNGFSTTGGGFIIHTAANKLRLSGSADTTGGSLLLDTADVIQVRNLANTAAGFIQGKLRTETAYTATVVAATGYITLYDSTGTAYRVPCAV